MEVTVIGAGGAFAPLSRGHSSFLVETQGRKILIDCGGSVPFILRDEMEYKLQEITDIIITHAHSDHIGGLETLLYSNKYMGQNPKPNIHTTHAVWTDLKMALEPGLSYSSEGHVDVESYFGSISRFCGDDDEALIVAGLPLRMFGVDHCGDMPAAGLVFGALAVSGDTLRPVAREYPGVTHWFHEAEFGFKSNVHCPVEALHAQTSDTLRKQLWLYHCPADANPWDFAGVLQKGQQFRLDYEY